MWKKLPKLQRQEYKRMILAFASLTELFAQKTAKNSGEDSGESGDNTETALPMPFVNSKYQEAIFQRVFNASAEDISNTSFDAAILLTEPGSYTQLKYLIGLKTFSLRSKSSQKIAQFKANRNDWSSILDSINQNSLDENGNHKTKDEIDAANNDLYRELSIKIAEVRNARIKSSMADLKGFKVQDDDDNIEAVYHFLMPSIEENKPTISVGELSYTSIDIDNITVEGCTTAKNPTNFNFNDGIHTYKYTAADSQLYMSFNDCSIEDTWNVQYADDAYSIFSHIADEIYGKSDIVSECIHITTIRNHITESYSWSLVNKNGEVEKYSGLNNFYGVGSKLSKDSRPKRVQKIRDFFKNIVPDKELSDVCDKIDMFLNMPHNSAADRDSLAEIRNEIDKILEKLNISDFSDEVRKLVYRPMTEMYISIPQSREFHSSHPDFFGPGLGIFSKSNPKRMEKQRCPFNLVFEPSGKIIPSFITQDNGKGIESEGKQSFLGEWILRGIFQLKPYEPISLLTMHKVGINGIRLYKIAGSDDVHLKFIWIDPENKPDDFWGEWPY